VMLHVNRQCPTGSSPGAIGPRFLPPCVFWCQSPHLALVSTCYRPARPSRPPRQTPACRTRDGRHHVAVFAQTPSPSFRAVERIDLFLPSLYRIASGIPPVSPWIRVSVFQVNKCSPCSPGRCWTSRGRAWAQSRAWTPGVSVISRQLSFLSMSITTTWCRG